MSDVAHAIKSQLFLPLSFTSSVFARKKSTVRCEPSQHGAGVGGEARRATALHRPRPADVSAQTRCEAVGSALQVLKKPILAPPEVGYSPKQSKTKSNLHAEKGHCFKNKEGNALKQSK